MEYREWKPKSYSTVFGFISIRETLNSQAKNTVFASKISLSLANRHVGKGIRHVNVGRPSTLLERIERLAVIHQVVRSQDVCHSVWVRSCCGSFFWQLFRSVAFHASRDKEIFLRGCGHGTYKEEWLYAIYEDIVLLQLSFHSIKIRDCFESLHLRQSFLFLWGKF